MKKIIFISALFALVACNNSSSSSNSQPNVTVIPASITNRALIQKPTLSPVQLQEITSIMNSASSLPDVDSLFANKRRGNDDGVLNWIRSQCQIQNPVFNRTGDLYQGGALSETKTKTIQGFGCPIYYSNNTRTDRTLTNTPTGNNSSVTETSDIVKTMVDGQLLNRTGVRTANTKITTTVISNTEQGLRRLYKTSTSTSTIATVRGANLTVSALSESLRQNNRGEDAYTEMNFQFPSSNPTVQIFKSMGRERYFLNGFEYDERQIKNIFGGAL